MSSGDELTPASQAELSRFLADNAAGKKQPIVPVGGRTALHFGYPGPTAGVLLSTAKLNRTVDYPSRDMTVTVEAGVRVADLAAMLAKEGQQLPVDVAQAERATLGGAVATNTSGPRRFGYGTFRDYVIGVTAVDATGKTFHAGGRVVKNVAGYDLCKLLVGSLGTLAVISQLTLKLRPLPEASAIVWAAFDDFEDIDIVLERLLTSATRPVSIEVLDARAAAEIVAEARLELPVERPVLAVVVEGSQREVDWQTTALQDELAPFGPRDSIVVGHSEATALLAALTDFQVCSDGPLTFQANLPPSRTMAFVEQAAQNGIAVQAHAGNGIVVGQLPDEVVTAEQAADVLSPLRQFARSRQGNLVILHCDDSWTRTLPVFGEPEQSWPLMQRVKQTLDPEHWLNPGRFIDGVVPA